MNSPTASIEPDLDSWRLVRDAAPAEMPVRRDVEAPERVAAHLSEMQAPRCQGARPVGRDTYRPCQATAEGWEVWKAPNLSIIVWLCRRCREKT